jgi:hypothetical protein
MLVKKTVHVLAYARIFTESQETTGNKADADSRLYECLRESRDDHGITASAALVIWFRHKFVWQ